MSCRHRLKGCDRRDPSFFRNPRGSGGAASDNWVLRFNSLKRLYKLVVSYFERVPSPRPPSDGTRSDSTDCRDELQKSTLKLTPTPDLQKIAKDQDEAEATSLTLLILTSVRPPLSMATGSHYPQGGRRGFAGRSCRADHEARDVGAGEDHARAGERPVAADQQGRRERGRRQADRVRSRLIDAPSLCTR